MSNGITVKIEGLREVQAALREIDRDLAKELQRGFKTIAVRIVDRIRSKAPGASGGAVRARATQRGASIVFPGGKSREGKYPFFPWLDFGGTTGKGHKIGVPFSGSVKRSIPGGGRYIYPTLAEESGALKETSGDLVLGLARRAGFVTHG